MRRTASVLLSLAIVSTLLGVPAAAAAGSTVSIGDDLVPGQGLAARFEAYSTLARLRDERPAGVPAEPVAEADRHARSALAHVRGDAMIAKTGFALDEKVVDALERLAGSTSTTAAVRTVGTGLVEADRIAAARELQVFLELPFTTTTASVDAKGRPVPRSKVVGDFTEEYQRSERASAAGDLESAVQHAGAAWQKVNAAITDYAVTSDTDGDLLSADRERALGLSPTSKDTDADGLADSVEVLTTMTDPTRPRSDGTTPDLTADRDRDGLGNDVELRLGTDPVDPDSDGDGLLDGAERTFGSDPLKADTDDDRLGDVSEQRLRTDPRDPDSDDDGVLDGDEVYASPVETGLAGVSVEVTGVGDVGRTVRVRDESASTRFADFPGKLSPAVDLSTTAAFTGADIAFAFDPAQVPGRDLANVKVGWYDEQTGLLVPMQTTVDPSGRATARADHFTTFVLFYVPNWSTAFTVQAPGGGPGNGGVGKVDVVLTLDSSGSMTTNDPQGLRRTAAKSFVDGLLEVDRAGVVDFDSFAALTQPLTTDHVAVKAAIDRINSSGGTDIGAGVRVGNAELIAKAEPDRAKAQIVLTDGEGAYDPALTTQAKDNGITVYTIGLGAFVDAALLQGIATSTGGQYFAVAQAADLPKVFDRIGSDIDPDADTDGDGLLDTWEITGMPMGTGIRVFTDPAVPDTDGDGLLDGDEMVTQTSTVGGFLPYSFWAMLSDPNEDDSDGDRLPDGEEVDGAAGAAMLPDQDSDGAQDGDEYERGWSVTDPNADGDGFDDGEELANRTSALHYDASLADRGRALVSGAILGEVGYWLADRGTSVGVSLLYPPFGPPQVVPEVAGLTPCDIPFVKCVDLYTFQAVDVEQVEYAIGMVVLGLVPFVDIVVAVRDTIGAAIQGEYGWAVFEVLGGALGFFVPVAGDVPGIVKDLGKHISRFPRSLDEVVRAVAQFEKLGAVRVPVIKLLKRSVTTELAGNGLTDAGLLGLAVGGRSLDELLATVRAADEVAPGVPGKFYDLNATRGHWGREAEDVVRAAKGGVSKRFPTTVQVRGKDSPRIVDSAVGPPFSLTEVKTGDGAYSSRMQTQIDKDSELLQTGAAVDYAWEFFPSGRSGTIGPDARTLAALQAAGLHVKIWLP